MHRKLDLDFLKAVAAFAVILLHTSSTCMVHVPKGSPEWMSLNAWNSMTHWAVGMFVMISGVLLLDSERNLSNRKLFSYVGHILRAIHLVKWIGNQLTATITHTFHKNVWSIVAVLI